MCRVLWAADSRSEAVSWPCPPSVYDFGSVRDVFLEGQHPIARCGQRVCGPVEGRMCGQRDILYAAVARAFNTPRKKRIPRGSIRRIRNSAPHARLQPERGSIPILLRSTRVRARAPRRSRYMSPPQTPVYPYCTRAAGAYTADSMRAADQCTECGVALYTRGSLMSVTVSRAGPRVRAPKATTQAFVGEQT